MNLAFVSGLIVSGDRFLAQVAAEYSRDIVLAALA
jgi:hypothetical protein